MKKVLLIIFCIVNFTNNLKAQQTYTATGDFGFWNDGSTWEGGVAPPGNPGSNTTIIIPEGTDVIRTLLSNAPLFFNDGNIQISGTLEVLNINGIVNNFLNNGTVTINSTGSFIQVNRACTISNNGQLNINGLLAFPGNLNSFEDGSTITNNNNINVTGEIKIRFNSQDRLTIRNNPGASFTNEITGKIGPLTNTNNTEEYLIINEGSFLNKGSIPKLRSIINSGSFVNQGTAIMKMRNHNTQHFLNTGSIINSGEFTLSHQSKYIQGATPDTKNEGTITNNVGGVFNISTMVDPIVFENNSTGSIINNGNITLSGSQTIFNNNGDLTNNGNCIVTNNGRLFNFLNITNNEAFINGATGTITNNDVFINAGFFDNLGTISINNSGQFVNSQDLHNSGNITNSGLFSNTSSGNLYGINSSHTGNFSNNGILSPGGFTSPVGTYILNNNYIHNSSQLNIGISSNTSFDLLNILGSASLSGILNVNLLNNFEPQLGDAFIIITAGSISGGFNQVNLPALSEGLLWTIDYQSTSVTLSIISELCDGGITTWMDTGGGVTDWNNGTPDSTMTAILREDYNTSTSGNIDACELIVKSGNTLTVTDDHYIIIENNITLDGALNIANAASIVQIANDAVTINNGTIAVAKTTPSLNPRDFIVLSSPMSAETNGGVYGTADRVFRILPDNFTPNVDVTADFPMAANFIDDNGDYLDNLELDNPNMMDDAIGLNNILTPAEGFLVFPQAVNATDPIVFNHTYTQGTLNSGDIVAPITYNGPASENNFNLLGNPYPSAIDTDMLIATNTAINEVYFWEHITAPDANLPGFNTQNFSMDDVSVRNVMMGIAAVNDMSGDAPGQFMASGQGFGILAEQSAATDVTFTNSMRVTGNNSTPRSSDQDNKLWLRLDSETYTIQSIAGIGFVPEATQGYDPGYDSRQLATTISLFSNIENGERLSIQGREIFDTSMEIDMGFQTLIPETENYTISIDHFEGLELEQNDIFLIDHLLGTTTNLKKNSYTFTSSETLEENRFTIVFENQVLNTEENIISDTTLRLYPNPSIDQITLAYNGDSSLQELIITDLQGKVIKQLDLTNFHQRQTIDVSRLSKGMYFFTITGLQNITTRRVIVN